MVTKSQHLVVLIYLLQGIGISYIGSSYKPGLESVGFDELYRGALSTLILLPFLLKIPLAYLYDKHAVTKPREQIIKSSSALGMLISITLVISQPISPLLLGALLFVVTTCIAICDVGADGIAIENANSENGIKNTIKVQSLMFSARAIGIALGASYFYFLREYGFENLDFMLYLAVFLLVFLLASSVYSEVSTKNKPVDVHRLKDAINMPFLLRIGLIGSLIFMLWGGIETMIVADSNSSSFTATSNTWYSTLGTYVRISGMIVATLFIVRYSFKFTYNTAFHSCIILSVSCWLMLNAYGITTFIVSQFIYGFSLSLLFIWLTSTIVKSVDPRFGAFSFTLVATICNIGFILSPTIFGFIEKTFGDEYVPIATSSLSLLIAVYLFISSQSLNVFNREGSALSRN